MTQSLLCWTAFVTSLFQVKWAIEYFFDIETQGLDQFFLLNNIRGHCGPLRFILLGTIK